MPIYEYVCMSCESHFEELVRNDETPACPDCGADEGAAAVLGVRGSRQPATSPAPAAARVGFGRWRWLWRHWTLWLLGH